MFNQKGADLALKEFQVLLGVARCHGDRDGGKNGDNDQVAGWARFAFPSLYSMRAVGHQCAPPGSERPASGRECRPNLKRGQENLEEGRGRLSWIGDPSPRAALPSGRGIHRLEKR